MWNFYFRSRNCKLLFSEEKGSICDVCQDLFHKPKVDLVPLKEELTSSLSTKIDHQSKEDTIGDSYDNFEANDMESSQPNDDDSDDSDPEYSPKVKGIV